MTSQTAAAKIAARAAALTTDQIIVGLEALYAKINPTDPEADQALIVARIFETELEARVGWEEVEALTMRLMAA